MIYIRVNAAAMYGSFEAFAPLTGPNHFFIPRDKLPYKFELGGFSHESAAATAALPAYLRFVADAPSSLDDRAAMLRAFDTIERIEAELCSPLLRFLSNHPRISLFGAASMTPSRVATVSCRVRGESRSASLARELCARNFGVKHGHFYSKRLVEALGMDPDDGVLRISLAHYNTPDEIARLTTALDQVL